MIACVYFAWFVHVRAITYTLLHVRVPLHAFACQLHKFACYFTHVRLSLRTHSLVIFHACDVRQTHEKQNMRALYLVSERCCVYTCTIDAWAFKGASTRYTV